MQPLARGQWNDRMFTAGESWGIPCTFRLQLFTANGHRPVALATQTADEGTSLTNAAERCAARVWELHTPEVAEKQASAGAAGPVGSPPVSRMVALLFPAVTVPADCRANPRLARTGRPKTRSVVHSAEAARSQRRGPIVGLAGTAPS